MEWNLREEFELQWFDYYYSESSLCYDSMDGLKTQPFDERLVTYIPLTYKIQWLVIAALIPWDDRRRDDIDWRTRTPTSRRLIIVLVAEIICVEENFDVWEFIADRQIRWLRPVIGPSHPPPFDPLQLSEVLSYSCWPLPLTRWWVRFICDETNGFKYHSNLRIIYFVRSTEAS